MDEASKKDQHWSYEQNLHYYFSLIFLYPVSKKPKFYKKMSMFVMKNNKQCRNHHEKMIKPFKKTNITDKETLYKQNIYQFYQQNYVLRRVDQAHLKYQLQSFLIDLTTNPKLKQNKKEYQDCRQQIDSILVQLDLQNNSNRKINDKMENKINTQTSFKIYHLVKEKQQQSQIFNCLSFINKEKNIDLSP